MADSSASGQGHNLDLSYLKEISGGNAEFMIEMIDIFLEQTPLYFTQLLSSVAAADWKAVGDLAHKIKPTLAFMGADQAKDDMQVLEKNARDGINVDTIGAEAARLEALCNQLYLKLREYKEELEKQG